MSARLDRGNRAVSERTSMYAPFFHPYFVNTTPQGEERPRLYMQSPVDTASIPQPERRVSPTLRCGFLDLLFGDSERNKIRKYNPGITEEEIDEHIDRKRREQSEPTTWESDHGSLD